MLSSSQSPVTPTALPATISELEFEHRWKRWQQRTADSEREFRARLRVVIPVLVVAAVGALILLLR
jgi:hypothetical protein